MMAMVRKPGWSLMSMMRASAMLHLPRRVADVEVKRDQHRGHQDQRLRAAQWPVAPRAELLRDQVADHQVDAAAQDQRRHIGAERRYEDQQAAGDDAGLRQR